MRALQGSHTLKTLFFEKQIIWTRSDELQALMTCHQEKWGDLSDDFLFDLEKEMEIPELVRTYRRSRLQAFAHGSLIK